MTAVTDATLHYLADWAWRSSGEQLTYMARKNRRLILRDQRVRVRYLH